MAATLVLLGSEGSLSLEVVNDNGWCRCYLDCVNAFSPLFLGADIVEHIVSRLLGALGEDEELAPVAGQIGTYNVRCALMLGEAHHVLYVAVIDSYRVLLWQRAVEPISIVGVLRLTSAQRLRWLVQLKELCPGIWPSHQGSGYLSQKPQPMDKSTIRAVE